MVPDDIDVSFSTAAFDRDEMREPVDFVRACRVKTMVRSSVPPVNSNIPIHFMLRKLG